MKVPHRHQLDLSVINEFCGYCPRECGTTVSFWRANHCLRNTLGSLGTSMGTAWPTNQLNANQVLLCLLANIGCYKFVSYIIGSLLYILGNFHCTRLPHSPQNAPNKFRHLSCMLSSTPSPQHLICLLLSSHAPSLPMKSISFPLTSEILAYFLDPSSLPNLSDYGL